MRKSVKVRKTKYNPDILCPRCKKSANDYGIYYPPSRIYFTCCGETFILTDRTRKRYLESKMGK